MRSLYKFAMVFALLMIHAACMQTTSVEAQNSGGQSKILPPDLTDTRWQLIKIQSMDDNEYIPDEPAKYQLTFLPAGELIIVADCNRGRGQWVQTGTSQLEFSQIVSTRAECGPNSLYNRFINNLNYIRSFVYVNGHIFLATMADGAILEFAPLSDNGANTQPSFDCNNTENTVETLICDSPQLAGLDRELQTLYGSALIKYPPEEINALKATQRGWIKGRNECWKENDVGSCTSLEYKRRITELQVSTGALVVPKATLFQCADNSLLTVYFYDGTKIPAAVINQTPNQYFAFNTPTKKGAMYVARNESLWLTGDSAVWQIMDKEIKCQKKK